MHSEDLYEMSEFNNVQEPSAQANKENFQSNQSKISPLFIDSKTSSCLGYRWELFQRLSQKIFFNFTKRFFREFSLKMVYLGEKKPTKFATTSVRKNR